VRWAISIPFRERSDSLIEVACSLGALPDAEDQAATRELIIAATDNDGGSTMRPLETKTSRPP
jgi:hypothetical protein